jgi:hypothetical protein
MNRSVEILGMLRKIVMWNAWHNKKIGFVLKFNDYLKKSMLLMRGLKKLSAVQKKLKRENLAKNGMLKPLAYVYVEIVAIPLLYLSRLKTHPFYPHK